MSGETVVTVSFDNLGEAADLGRGRWPADAPVGRHPSVTRTLPALLALLDELGLRATFFVEALNAELYPQALAEIARDGHEVALHGFCHEAWAELDPAREEELLERGRAALGGLGLEPVGFRPPGGRLAPSSPATLARLRFAYCSPAGTGPGRVAGLAVVPFDWLCVDAVHYLPRFAELRERRLGSREARPPARLRETLDTALDRALARGGHHAVLFHPFLVEPGERSAVLRGHLERVRDVVAAGAAWCGTHRDLAARLRASPSPVRLDPTPA